MDILILKCNIAIAIRYALRTTCTKYMYMVCYNSCLFPSCRAKCLNHINRIRIASGGNSVYKYNRRDVTQYIVPTHVYLIIYPLHTQCDGTRLCIRSSLLCEPVSLRVVIATSCDAVSSRERRDLI